MKEEYVIVHQGMIERSAKFYVPSSMWALRKINKLDKFHPKRLREEPADTIHPELPPPSDDLEIIVCGALRELCVEIQKKALMKKGYSVKVDREATICGTEPLNMIYDNFVALLKLVRERYSK